MRFRSGSVHRPGDQRRSKHVGQADQHHDQPASTLLAADLVCLGDADAVGAHTEQRTARQARTQRQETATVGLPGGRAEKDR